MVGVGVFLMLSGCVTGPPVQEMSDARMALGVAKEAGAEQLANEHYTSAAQHLAAAQISLNNKSYSVARREALLAKDLARKALEGAEASGQNLR